MGTQPDQPLDTPETDPPQPVTVPDAEPYPEHPSGDQNTAPEGE